MKPTIVLAADHAGFQLKEKVKEHLLKRRYAVKDMGTHSYDDDDDYPEFIIPAAREVARHPHAKGIIFGGSGQGAQDGQMRQRMGEDNDRGQGEMKRERTRAESGDGYGRGYESRQSAGRGQGGGQGAGMGNGQGKGRGRGR